MTEEEAKEARKLSTLAARSAVAAATACMTIPSVQHKLRFALLDQ